MVFYDIVNISLRRCGVDAVFVQGNRLDRVAEFRYRVKAAHAAERAVEHHKECYNAREYSVNHF